MTDTNLSDDMVKLVRYDIVSIERDALARLVSGEYELFDDNMDAQAFANWVTAKHSAALSGRDSKYLRVAYEVEQRWPKQDREYERKQLHELEGIRQAIESKELSRGNPFDHIGKTLDGQVDRLRGLRADFQRCAAGISEGVAATFEAHRQQGAVKAVKVGQEALQEVLEQGLDGDFDVAGLERFPGRWVGTNRRYMLADGKEVESDAVTWHMRWEPGWQRGDEYVQRVVGSLEHHYDSDALPPLGENKVDLALNVYRPEIGITGWLSTRVEARQELALIAYQFDPNTFLWVGQVLTPQLEPVMDAGIFWMFLEWIRPGAKPVYSMYGLMFTIDFDACTAVPFGDSFRKARFDFAKD